MTGLLKRALAWLRSREVKLFLVRHSFAMAAVGFYNEGKGDLGTATWVAGGDYRLLLIDNAGTYTFNADHDFVAGLTPGSNESTGTGYARKTLTGFAVTVDDANDWAEYDATDPTIYSGADFGVIQAAVVFRFVTNDAASPLICYLDGTGFPITTNSGDLTLQFHADGVFKIT